jgi:biopolymer transport protein ExbD
MPKVNMPKGTPSLDMTPLVDLAFLLVTFFMLTASFRQAEPVKVTPPSSISLEEMPKFNFATSIDETGRVFVDIQPSTLRGAIFSAVAKKLGYQTSEKDSTKFVGAGPFGLKFVPLLKYVNLSSTERESVQQNGIPYDTSGKKTELNTWIEQARIVSQNIVLQEEADAIAKKKPYDKMERFIKFSIKADGRAKYDQVKQIIDVYRDARVKKFQMVTQSEEAPNINLRDY